MQRTARKPYNRPTARPTPSEGQWLHDKAPTGPKGRISASKSPAIPSGPAASMNNTLLVSNLHYEVSPKDLIAIFGTIGTLMREPLVRYDTSGRSTGEAVVWFETAAEATRAKKQFTGILAKGQPMTITYDVAPRAPRRTASTPSFSSTRSLLNRVEKPPLAERLTKEESSKIPKGPKAPTGPRNLTGPARNRPAKATTKPAPAPKRNNKAKTAEELDLELDAFMGDADTDAPLPAAASQDGSDGFTPADTGDIDMSFFAHLAR
ncbi:hypothetical protein CPB83DRAFT_892835 [Crepidotus variabilis]|uniref:RRM domain-containing protein n=1 Tax=Crepidotus variabilis TaxID=179855 RepID=A0A9P6EIC5_9AGAR|nr:hypothetical protein CPB83DRAFT_892835 [Crepidotus variabilis]